MKKTLLTIFSLAALSVAVAQTPSPSWTIVQNAAFTQTSTGIKFMDAVDANVMWVTGYDGFAPSRNYNWFSRTLNGGTTFTSGVVFSGTNTLIGDTNYYVLANLDAIDANTAWVSAYTKTGQGSLGAIFRTTNGGQNWYNLSAPGMYTNAASFCNIVAFMTPSIGITMGDPHPGVANEFEIWRTTNGGNSWSLIPAGNIPNPTTGEFGLVNVYCTQGNSNIWFGTNKARVVRSTDGGLTWSASALPTGFTSTTSVNDIAFTDPLNGFCYAYNGSTNPATFETYRTNDGGATWTNIAVPANVGRNDLNNIPGANVLVSAGASTVNGGFLGLSYSTDGGQNWIDWGSTGLQYLTINFANNATGWSGAFSDVTDPTLGGIWKYNGTPFTTPLIPTSAFQVPSNVCFTGPTATIQTVNTSTGNPAPTYSWTGTPGATFSSPTASAPVITFTAVGVYTITLAATNSITSNTSQQIVNVLACSSPSSAFTFTSNVCNNVNFTVTNTSSGAPAPTFTWSTAPAGNVTIAPSPNAMNPAFKFQTPGVYSITLMSSNQQGSVSVTQTVNVNNCAPSANFTFPTEACTVAVIQASNTTSGSGNTYTWSVNPTPTSILPNAIAQSPTITISNVNTYTVTLLASNISGTASVSKIISVGACVGIEENSMFAENVLIYPNPAADKLIIEVSGVDSFNYKLTNILGKVVLDEKSSKEKVKLNVENIAPGIYFLTLENKGQKITRKIIIE
jgi:hypothetical protein